MTLAFLPAPGPHSSSRHRPPSSASSSSSSASSSTSSYNNLSSTTFASTSSSSSLSSASYSLPPIHAFDLPPPTAHPHDHSEACTPTRCWSASLEPSSSSQAAYYPSSYPYPLTPTSSKHHLHPALPRSSPSSRTRRLADSRKVSVNATGIVSPVGVDSNAIAHGRAMEYDYDTARLGGAGTRGTAVAYAPPSYPNSSSSMTNGNSAAAYSSAGTGSNTAYGRVESALSSALPSSSSSHLTSATSSSSYPAPVPASSSSSGHAHMDSAMDNTPSARPHQSALHLAPGPSSSSSTLVAPPSSSSLLLTSHHPSSQHHPSSHSHSQSRASSFSAADSRSYDRRSSTESGVNMNSSANHLPSSSTHLSTSASSSSSSSNHHHHPSQHQSSRHASGTATARTGGSLLFGSSGSMQQQVDTTFVPQNTGDMICYLWFATNLSPRRDRDRSSPTTSTKNSPLAASTTSPSSSKPSPFSISETHRLSLQFSPSPPFIAFLSTLLRTTQVSQSVIILALHYIYRLKTRNPHIRGLEGSEFRLAVIALLLANKFLDDNTYTNKTWSDVSGIALSEINLMEREFLQGVEHALYIDLGTYQRWGKLLGGLLMAKERDKGAWRRRYAAATAAMMRSVGLGTMGGLGSGIVGKGLYAGLSGAQTSGYLYPSPPQDLVRKMTSTNGDSPAQNGSSRAVVAPPSLPRPQTSRVPTPTRPRAVQTPTSVSQLSQSMGDLTHSAALSSHRHLAPILPHPSHAYPYPSPHHQQYQHRPRADRGVSSSSSSSRTRARSSSPLGRMQLPLSLHLPLPVAAPTIHAPIPDPLQQFPFTFALPEGAPTVSRPILPPPAPSTSSGPSTRDRDRPPVLPPVLLGSKRGADEADERPSSSNNKSYNYGSPTVIRRTSPPLAHPASNGNMNERTKVPRLEQPRPGGERDFQQQLAQLSLAGSNGNASAISARNEEARFVDPNDPAGSVYVRPAEPTLQRTLQAKYEHDADVWAMRRGVPQYLTFNALASSPMGTLRPTNSSKASSSTATTTSVPTPTSSTAPSVALPTYSSSSSATASASGRAAHSYVSVPRGARKTVLRYDEPLRMPSEIEPAHPHAQPQLFVWPTRGSGASMMPGSHYGYHLNTNRQGSVSAHTSPVAVFEHDRDDGARMYYSGGSEASDEIEEDGEDEDDDDEDEMVLDSGPTPTPTRDRFPPVSSAPYEYRHQPSAGVDQYQSHQQVSPTTPTSAVSASSNALSHHQPTHHSHVHHHPSPPTMDMNVQLAPFANAGPAGINHWSTGISPQSRPLVQSQSQAHHQGPNDLAHHYHYQQHHQAYVPIGQHGGALSSTATPGSGPAAASSLYAAPQASQPLGSTLAHTLTQAQALASAPVSPLAPTSSWANGHGGLAGYDDRSALLPSVPHLHQQQQQVAQGMQEHEWSPVAAYGHQPHLNRPATGAWSEAPSPVSRGRRM